MAIKYQQGDVLLVDVPTDEIEIDGPDYVARYPNKDKKIVLAEGEATGHHHRFELGKLSPGVSVTAYHSRARVARLGNLSIFPTHVLIEGGEATLYHEEHKPLSIPPGLYRRSIVREFDHIGNSTREVVD